MDEKLIKDCALEIYNAEKNCSPMGALTDRFSDITIEDAYKIQMAVVDLKLKDGEKIIGKKIGLTNKAIREQIGVHEPDYGIITSSGFVGDGGELDSTTLIAPRIEPEIAFVLKSDLTVDMYPVNNMDIINATLGICPALEVVDSRVKDWKIKIQDTISDSASYARIVLGNRITPLDGLDLRVIGMASYVNGELVTHGSSANVMGNPIEAVTWLTNKLLKYGVELKAGEIILSGSFTPVFSIKKGDSVLAIFDRLGEVSARVIWDER